MRKKVINVISAVLLVILVGCVIFTLYQRVSGEPPKLFGYQFFRVSTASMEPDLMVGEIILCRDVPVSDIQKGDVVTYQGMEGELKDKIITHKVIEQPYKSNDVYYLQTKGIAEGAKPDPLVAENQVYGKMIVKIPFLNYLFDFFISPYGFVIILVVLVLMFANEFIILTKIIKNPVAKTQPTEDNTAQSIPDHTEEPLVQQDENTEQEVMPLPESQAIQEKMVTPAPEKKTNTGIAAAKQTGKKPGPKKKSKKK